MHLDLRLVADPIIQNVRKDCLGRRGVYTWRLACDDSLLGSRSRSAVRTTWEFWCRWHRTHQGRWKEEAGGGRQPIGFLAAPRDDHS
jgi:hypothetical protein